VVTVPNTECTQTLYSGGKKGRDSACINGAYGSELKWIELADNTHVVSFLYIAEEIIGFIA